MDKLNSWIQERRGRLSELATSLNITPAAIKQWQIVPADKLVAIEAFTGIPRQELRPDLFEGMRETAA
jgi:DNA-binding transcriptional regulator YdaS (Cro superfamily)